MDVITTFCKHLFQNMTLYSYIILHSLAIILYSLYYILYYMTEYDVNIAKINIYSLINKI